MTEDGGRLVTASRWLRFSVLPGPTSAPGAAAAPSRGPRRAWPGHPTQRRAPGSPVPGLAGVQQVLSL